MYEKYNDDMFKPINKDYWQERSSLEKDLEQIKLMASKVIEFRPENNEYFTFDELLKQSDLTREQFNDNCWSWYISLEEDDWDPCIELCGLCSIMKTKYNKYWYPKERVWK